MNPSWSDSHIKANFPGTERPERSGSSAEQAGSGGADTATASPQVPFSLPLAPRGEDDIEDANGTIVVMNWLEKDERDYVIAAVNQHEELKRQLKVEKALSAELAAKEVQQAMRAESAERQRDELLKALEAILNDLSTLAHGSPAPGHSQRVVSARHLVAKIKRGVL